jgi:K+-sensing histidine kinase KdpD
MFATKICPWRIKIVSTLRWSFSVTFIKKTPPRSFNAISATSRNGSALKIKKEQFSSVLEKRVLELTAELEAFRGAVSHDLQAPLRHLASNLGELQDQTEQTFFP